MIRHIVLCNPADARNIGAVLRACANFGICSLRVVAEHAPNEDDLRAFSRGGRDLVELSLFPDLPAAVADCDLVVGTSRRDRREDQPRSVTLDRLAEHIVDVASVALVFGTERTGLTIGELDRCDAVVEIPTSALLPSMNLSHAVAVVAYELARPRNAAGVARSPPPAARAAARDGFFDYVQATVAELGYPPGRTPEAFTRRLRKMLGRANLSPDELSLLAGIFTEWLRQARLAKPPTT